MRRLLAVPLLLLALPGSAAGATTSVTLRNIDISRPVARIGVGDSVKWRFRDGSTPHNVTSTGERRFRSSMSMSSGTYAVRFTTAGTYRYYCTIHPSMTGKVVVG